jgi:hypothetical protein
VVAAASPPHWLVVALPLPNGRHDRWVRWLFLGQLCFLSACMLVSAFEQYRVSRLQADLE